MVKIAANRADSFPRKPDPSIRAVLVYGPDSGLVRERAEALVKSAAGMWRAGVDASAIDASRFGSCVLHG